MSDWGREQATTRSLAFVESSAEFSREKLYGGSLISTMRINRVTSTVSRGCRSAKCVLLPFDSKHDTQCGRESLAGTCSLQAANRAIAFFTTSATTHGSPSGQTLMLAADSLRFLRIALNPPLANNLLGKTKSLTLFRTRAATPRGIKIERRAATHADSVN